MLAVIGTVPDPDFPLVHGEVILADETLTVAGQSCPVNRGTPALLAAAWQTAQTLGQPSPQAYLSGDIGLGDGSKKLYGHLCEQLPQSEWRTLCFHYLQPDVDWHNRVWFAIEAMAVRPILIADAGFMYVAKMSGQAGEYDLFTPDVGELAFLADEEAPHHDLQGNLYYLKYPLKDNPDEHVIVATTRPETMLGDTAVAVNPKDKRYRKGMMDLTKEEIK